MTRVAAWLGIAFGSVAALLEFARNWGHWQWWPFWLVDFVAAALLVSGGVLALRLNRAGLLTAGWGFTCAMFWMSFFSHVESLRTAAAADPREARLTTIIGGMFLVTVLGLVFSLGGALRDRSGGKAT